MSQNYVPANEANSREAGPKLQQEMLIYFNWAFEELFETVLVSQEAGEERRLVAKT